MTTTKHRVPRPVVLLLHQNGTGHVRADRDELLQCARILTATGVNWPAQLSEKDVRMSDGAVATAPVLEDIYFDDAVPFIRVARSLARHLPDCHAYETTYDTHSDGPTVRYVRVNGAPRAGGGATWLQLVDYGYEDGCWVFGHPRLVRKAAVLARDAGMPVYGHPDKLGVGQSCAVDASRTDELFRLLVANGISVQVDIFRPDAYFDDQTDGAGETA